jgi:hypothetical protein
LKQGETDHPLQRTHSGRSYGPVTRQNPWMMMMMMMTVLHCMPCVFLHIMFWYLRSILQLHFQIRPPLRKKYTDIPGLIITVTLLTAVCYLLHESH